MPSNTMKPFTLAGIGELLWDILDDSEELGGAPINFAYHANGLGANGIAISTVGDDRRGTAALLELQKRSMSTAHIAVLKGGVTGYVRATVDEQGVAAYEFPDDVAWDNLTLQDTTMSLAKEVDAVCFGSLGQRSPVAQQAIVAFLQATPADTLKIFDINLRQDFYRPEIIRQSLGFANVLKLNDEELAILGDMDGIQGDETERLQRLVHNYNLQLVILTRGGRGSLLLSPTETSDHPGYAVDVIDTIGAGDAFTAAATLGLLQGSTLAAINDEANRVAAFVCSQKGAMPVRGQETT